MTENLNVLARPKKNLEKEKYMGANSKIKSLLCLCVLSFIFFLIGHLLGERMLVYVGTILLGAVFVIFSDYLIYLTLFFTPMLNIVKLSSSGASLVGYITILSFAIFFFKSKGRKIKLMPIVAPIALLVIIFVKELLYSYGASNNNYRALLVIIITSIIYANSAEDCGGFEFDAAKASLFLTSGVLLSSIFGYVFFDNANLSEFFSVTDSFYYEKDVISRFCGLSNDPNYYSAIVLMAIALNLYLFVSLSQKRYLLCVGILFAFGLLSWSKMFILCFFIIFTYFLVCYYINHYKNNKSFAKIIFLYIVVIGVVFLILSKTDYFDIISARIRDSGDITSGRADIWREYISKIFKTPNILALGVENEGVRAAVNVTHNTLLQVVWKFGSIGLAFYIFWFVYNTFSMPVAKDNHNRLNSFIIMLAIFLPSMSIDRFYFDEIYWFYIVYLLCRSDRYASVKEQTDDHALQNTYSSKYIK